MRGDRSYLNPIGCTWKVDTSGHGAVSLMHFINPVSWVRLPKPRLSYLITRGWFCSIIDLNADCFNSVRSRMVIEQPSPNLTAVK